jgi:uncharacterized protein YbaP (TraB family)
VSQGNVEGRLEDPRLMKRRMMMMMMTAQLRANILTRRVLSWKEEKRKKEMQGGNKLILIHTVHTKTYTAVIHSSPNDDPQPC